MGAGIEWIANLGMLWSHQKGHSAQKAPQQAEDGSGRLMQQSRTGAIRSPTEITAGGG
ncbi:hypothetical protein BOX15_Mlig006163g1, partial [Macrostomum lignano]